MAGNTSAILILLGAGVAGLGGGLLAQALEPAPAPVRAEAPRDDHQGPRIDALARTLDERLAALEARLAAAPAPPPARPEKADAPPPAPREPARGPVVTLLEELGSQPYTHRRSSRLFEHLARHRGEIASAVERLEAAIERDPRNAHLHAALGTALAAKTAFATPPGPEQGTVWELAEQAFLEAITLDPDHWEARYSLAFGDSMAPEFVGLRPRAIERFEELMEVQERQAPADEHVLVYVRLGTLYKDAGNAKKARAVWERGLARFPESAELEQALALIGKD